VRRSGRRLLRHAGVWAVEGTVNDQFIPLTEGVVAHETLATTEDVVDVVDIEQSEDALTLGVRLRGGREAELRLAFAADNRIELALHADGEPLRLGADWDTRAEERFVGLGARHGVHFDQAGRAVQLGADRRYTGPDCPAELLAEGGIPQGDYAPMPWLQSSRGYAVWAQSEAAAPASSSARTGSRCRCGPPPGRCGCTCSAPPPRRRGCATSAA
jgi:hypothetical protein